MTDDRVFRWKEVQCLMSEAYDRACDEHATYEGGTLSERDALHILEARDARFAEAIRRGEEFIAAAKKPYEDELSQLTQ